MQGPTISRRDLLVTGVLAGAGIVVGGCSSGSKSGANGGAASSSGGSATAVGVPSSSATASATASAKPGGSLVIWSSWNKGEPMQLVLQKIIDDFSAETGANVDVQWKGRQVATAVLPTLTAGHPPMDILDGKGITTTLAPADAFIDLTDVYGSTVYGESKTIDQTIGAGFKQSLAYVSDDNGKPTGPPVALPYWSDTFAVWYNAARFPDLAANPPKTWSDFIALMDTQKAKGRHPLALDGSVASAKAYYFQFLSQSAVSPEGWQNALLDATGAAWADPGFLTAAQTIEKLAKGDYFITGYNASKFPAMEDKWANNDSDFIIMGTWLPAEVRSVAASGFDFRSFRIPAVGTQKAPPLSLSGAAMGIAKASKNQETAKRFLSFLLRKQNEQLVAANELPVRSDVTLAPSLTALASDISSGDINTILTPTRLGGYLTGVLYPLESDLLFGKTTAAKFISDLKSKSAQYWSSKK